jgi:hypothetical protein
MATSSICCEVHAGRATNKGARVEELPGGELASGPPALGRLLIDGRGASHFSKLTCLACSRSLTGGCVRGARAGRWCPPSGSSRVVDSSTSHIRLPRCASQMKEWTFRRALRSSAAVPSEAGGIGDAGSSTAAPFMARRIMRPRRPVTHPRAPGGRPPRRTGDSDRGGPDRSVR